LRSIIALVQNQKKEALRLARQAVELEPQSPVPYVARSYAEQSAFKIEEALASIKEASSLAPEDALVWARRAELELSLGDLDEALAAARKAQALDPKLARTQTVLGFAHLTRIDVDEARTAFDRAIALDPADPLPRLGLGLAKIRESDVDEGTKEIETAASLDPNNSLIRSYLGKAYFEQKRGVLVSTEFEQAKLLDPKDPTPWFYDAIHKQTTNRPVEALHDLQKAIELNDNRAVYRSRLLLDDDLAARSAALGRIYNDLGFQQLGLVEGWKSVNTDPSNYSAHRLLADNYAALPRHEIARVSELLQSQLLQPINITSVQPNLAESNLLILEASGPSDTSFNEFNPLFARNRLALQVSGVVGSNDTYGDEVVQSGLWGKYSYSLGQFHFETDGFRENNDLKQDIYNVFLQGAITPQFNVQAEYRRRETKQGDLALNFNPENFSRDTRREFDQDTARLGARFSPSPQSDLIISGIYTDAKPSLDQFIGFPNPDVQARSDLEGYQVEAQYIFRYNQLNAAAGGGMYDIASDTRTRLQFPIPCPLPACDLQDKFHDEHYNAYLYTNLVLLTNLTWTIGLSYDAFDRRDREFEKVNPKVGVQWNFTDWARLRLAYFQAVKRVLVADQTIEPTQVAGFNQFFDDPNGTKTERYGAALDALLTDTLYGGLEYSRRDLEVPSFSLSQLRTESFDRWEDAYRAYLYWTPHRHWAVSAQAEFERFKRAFTDPGVTQGGVPSKVETFTFPLATRYFHPRGFFATLGGTLVRQEVDLAPMSTFADDEDSFFILDATVGYRLPNRRGIISLEARNLLDEEFFFQDLNIQTVRDAVNPRFVPDRTIFIRATFAFN
jgi:tetratricopeptide (TPR) repeat protein